eukprot:Ihof_evm2s1316 gene=Ihof_evmTU2s1316
MSEDKSVEPAVTTSALALGSSFKKVSQYFPSLCSSTMVPEVSLIGCNPKGQSAPPVTESIDVDLTEGHENIFNFPLSFM